MSMCRHFLVSVLDLIIFTPVGDKRMESFGVVVYVTKYYLGIGPKELFKIGVV